MAFVGAYFTKDLSNRTLEFATGVYLLLISMFFFWNSYTGTYGESSDGNKTVSNLTNKVKHLFK
jgi:uncharacterized membrane protein YfcA